MKTTLRQDLFITFSICIRFWWFLHRWKALGASFPTVQNSSKTDNKSEELLGQRNYLDFWGSTLLPLTLKKKTPTTHPAGSQRLLISEKRVWYATPSKIPTFFLGPQPTPLNENETPQRGAESTQLVEICRFCKRNRKRFFSCRLKNLFSVFPPPGSEG